MLLLWLLVSCILQHMWLEKVGAKEAMYEVNIISYEPDPNCDDKLIISKSMRVTRKGRNNYAISGEFETFQNWGNENTMHYQLTNSHGMLLYRGSKPFCEAFNWQHPVVMKMREYSTMPPGNYCPLPKGNYEIVDFRVQEDDLPLVAIKDTYTVQIKMTAADGHMVFAYKVQFSIS